MATFKNYKDDMKEHKASDRWVTSATSTDDIYWKLLYSNTALSKSVPNYPNTNEFKSNLQKLSKVVSAIAKTSGFKIFVNSGYRSKEVNSTVGGATSSQHMKGQAVDMDCNSKSTVDNAKLFLFLVNSPKWKNKIDQIIWEKPGSSIWVHCSFKIKDGDISNDTTFNPRPYSRTDKVYYFNGSKYINIWTGNYKRMTNDGYVYFEGVPGLSGVKYDGKTFDVDLSKISDPVGSDINESASSSGSASGGQEYTPTYGSSTGGKNTVTNLSKARNRMKGTDPVIDENRKRNFDALANALIEGVPLMGRKIVKSPEMYDTSILKGDQLSKMRVSNKNKNNT